jgi:GT2 family glycosyltransferase
MTRLIDNNDSMEKNSIPMDRAAQVAIVIVSYNTRDLLLECLASVWASAADLAVETVVVDNASDDSSYEEVLRAYPEARAIRNEENLGFGAACNQGIRLTRAPYVLLLNSDARLTTDALSALCAALRSNERCGAAGCRIISPAGEPVNSTRNFLTPFNQALELVGLRLPSRYLSRTYEPKVEGVRTDCQVDWIEGACLMLRREALDEVGLMDERFFMYSEDEDLCLRLKARNWAVCYSGEGAAIHHGGASSKRHRRDLLTHFYRSQMLLLGKHNGRLSVTLYALATGAALRLKRLAAPLSPRGYRKEELYDRLYALKRARAGL